MKLITNLVAVAVAAVIISAVGGCKVQAQTITSINSSQFSTTPALWSMIWGSDATVTLKTNGIISGGDNPSMIAGGAPYTSDIWTLSLIFNSGSVAVSATSANAPGLNWNASYSTGSLTPLKGLLFGANYQADNGESLAIGSVSINNIPLTGTALANSSQGFGGLSVSSTTAITLASFTVSISTPTSWERQFGGQPALLSTLVIPAAVPEPATSAIAGIGLLLTVMKLRRRM
ncbi:MAG: PEP-CTERM sorting domain-containing protein [bacterium]